MKQSFPSQTLANGSVDPAHAVEVLCLHCGYDLDASEIAADTCADCGEALNLKQSIAIQVTTLPSSVGGVM